MGEDRSPVRQSSSPPLLHIRALPESYGNTGRSFQPPSQQEGLLGIRPDELRRTALLGLYLFVASCVFVLGRTVRDAFFLSHYGDRVGELLPYMFIAYGVASAAVAVLYARLACSVRRDRFVIGFSVLSAVSYVLVRLLVPADPSWLYSVLYVWAEIVGNLVLAQFWSVANDLHDARSAKRLFGVIGLGRIAGLVLCGLGTGSFVREIGTDNLLLVLAALLGLIVGFIVLLARDYGLAQTARPSRKPPRGASIVSPLRSKYVRWLAAMMLTGFVVVNVGDFQFKAAARLVHPERDALAHFMALYYATMGAVALLLQVLATRSVLRRFGVAGGMLALPLAYLLANIGLLAVPSLQFATILKISDNAFQFTLFEATLQLLYFPLTDDTKESVRSFLEAIAKPLGYGLAGAIVLALRTWQPPDSMAAIAAQSWFVLPLAVGWIATIPLVRKHYLDALERSLTRREADPVLAVANDAHTRQILFRALSSPSPRAVRYAFEQLSTLDPPTARSALPILLQSPHPSVRATALQAVATLRADSLCDAVVRALDDPDDAVAATAAETLGELKGEDCLPALAGHVHSHRPLVQEAVLATLLRRGGLEGVLIAGRVVEAWLASQDPSDRIRAAQLFARPGIPGLNRVVRRLLEDPDPAVRRAALSAAGAVADPKLCELVLRAMSDPASERAAARALVQIGEPAIPLIDRALGDPRTQRSVRLALPRVLAQMRLRASYQTLLRHIDTPDEWIRQKVLASASRARAAGGFDALPAHEATPRMLRELEGVTRLRTDYQHVRASLAIPLLDRWVLERLRKGLIRVLRLGELSHPKTQVAAARDALFSTDVSRRARAVEILENLFDPDVRSRFVDELDAYISLRSQPLGPPSAPTGSEEAFVRQLVSLPEPFAKIVGLDAAQFRGIRLPEPTMIELTRDEDPAVREMAALVIATFRPSGWRDILNALRSDEDLRVRTYAEYAFTTGRTGMDPWDEMYTTLEKVLFLQRIPLFEDVPPEHLVSLARSAEVERHSSGSMVFRTGDPGDALYFIIDGKVQIITPSGATIELGEGEVFGEMSVLDSAPRSADALVVEDATLLRIAQEDFYDVLHETTELAEGVIHVLVRRLRAASAG